MAVWEAATVFLLMHGYTPTRLKEVVDEHVQTVADLFPTASDTEDTDLPESRNGQSDQVDGDHASDAG
jgi:hypothetical protein